MDLQKNQNIQHAALFLLGVIVGVSGCWVFVHKNETLTLQSSIMAENNLSAATEALIMVGDNSLSVDNQPAGTHVAVEQVVLKNPGWVAIHDDVNGVPGKILGAILFPGGKNAGSVPLLRNTVAGKTYFAMLHSDEEDFHNFNPKIDMPLPGKSGMPIMVQFIAQ